MPEESATPTWSHAAVAPAGGGIARLASRPIERVTASLDIGEADIAGERRAEERP